MTNEYFDSTDYTALTRLTLARAEALNAILSALAAAFDKFPTEAELKQGKATYCGASTGSSNVYAVSLPYPADAYYEGMHLSFKPNHTNDDAATVNADTLGAIAIKRQDGSAVSDGDLRFDSIVEVRNNGTDFTLITATNETVSSASAAAASAAAALVSENAAAADAILTAADVISSAANAAAALAAATGFRWKDRAKAATTANITLSGAQTIDGISLVAGDRCLVKDQTSTDENGVYVVAVGAWARATDVNTWDEIVSAAFTVEQGTVNADRMYLCTSDSGGTLETTAVTFSRIGQDGTVTGPGSSTDNAWARHDGTGGTAVQDGAWVEDDSGNVVAGGNLAGDDKQLSGFNMLDMSWVHKAHGDTLGVDIAINLNDGNYHSMTISTDAVTLSFSNWVASDELQCVLLKIVNGGSQTLNLPASADFEGGAQAWTFSAAGTDFVLVWTDDGGTITHWQQVAIGSA